MTIGLRDQEIRVYNDDFDWDYDQDEYHEQDDGAYPSWEMDDELTDDEPYDPLHELFDDEDDDKDDFFRPPWWVVFLDDLF